MDVGVKVESNRLVVVIVIVYLGVKVFYFLKENKISKGNVLIVV